MLRKVLIMCLLVILLLVGSACQPEPEEFDEEALLALNNYVDELSTAMLDQTLKADLKGWVRDYYEDDLPLQYDEERRAWLAEHRDNLNEVRRRHRTAAFPSDETIAGWQVIVVRSGSEWLLEGEEALAALNKLESIYAELIAVIEMIIGEEGELDMPQSERVLELIDELEPQVNEVRAYYFH